MKFSKLNYAGQYQGTRKDGQVIMIEKMKCEDTGKKYWLTTYENDFDGDNNSHSKTLKDAKAIEQRIEYYS